MNIRFNPCYVGYRSERVYTVTHCFQLWKVSILVMLDIGLKVSFVTLILIEGFQVSILVMLDIGLKAIKTIFFVTKYSRFNPCYVGYRSERGNGRTS